jgi:hypothetical protein
MTAVKSCFLYVCVQAQKTITAQLCHPGTQSQGTNLQLPVPATMPGDGPCAPLSNGGTYATPPQLHRRRKKILHESDFKRLDLHVQSSVDPCWPRTDRVYPEVHRLDRRALVPRDPSPSLHAIPPPGGSSTCQPPAGRGHHLQPLGYSPCGARRSARWQAWHCACSGYLWVLLLHQPPSCSPLLPAAPAPLSGTADTDAPLVSYT